MNRELPKWALSVTGSEDTEPNLINPSAGAELSSRQRLRRGEDKPGRKGSRVDNAGPDLALLRSKGGSSERRRSRTGEAKPKQLVPEAGGPKPVRDALLTRGGRPVCRRSEANVESPRRAKDLDGKGGSIAQPFSARGEDPNLDMPSAGMAGSAQPGLRTKSGKPKRRRSNTEAAGPRRPHERTGKDEPG